MKILMCGAAGLMLLSLPAAAENSANIEPNQMTAAVKRPTLEINDQQRAVIQAGLAAENTQQNAPDKFEPKVGDTIPLSMNVDVMPEDLVRREPSLQPYGYAKLAKQVLVIDPMKKTIIAVLPRSAPTSGKDEPPADWAATRGRELTGQAPEPLADKNQAPEPAGDSGDKANGTEKNAKEK